ncbi:MAG TPA: class I SAM-dependent methyltransferase [Burkholderiales bacterium]|nr:class I SAM-dependent methyltransferase [Burkholderiales bacterium]
MIRAAALALAFAFSTFAQAQASPASQPSGKFEPEVGQPGKDVVWVPTPQAVVDKMLDTANVTPADFVMDLGSGDGRTVITAARRGARALGIEYNADMVALSKENADKAGVASRAQFENADLFKTDLTKATVITMFLLPEINKKLRPAILKLKPGTRVVSNTFTMGEWEPDETFIVTPEQGCESSWCTVLFWIVPAQVAGNYKTAAGEFNLKQDFQMLIGTMRAGGRTVPVEGKVRGEEITLTTGAKTWHGRKKGNSLELR